MPNDPGSLEQKPDGAIQQEEEQEEVTFAQDLFSSLQTLVWIVLFIITVFAFVARIIVVDGSSMEKTLFEPDIVLVRSIGYTPKKGDIVVLTKTSFREQSIIKRVIAVGGQTVDIDYNTSTVYVDGVPQDEPWLWEPMQEPWWDGALNHVTVPYGSIFVMGDNRNGSSDSRYPLIGLVDTRCVIGRAVAVIFPFTQLQLL